jgi:hypothetical protein
LTLNKNTIDNIPEPKNLTDAISREFAINFNNLTTHDIVGIENTTTDVGHTYTTSEVINSVVFRNPNLNPYQPFNLALKPDLINFFLFIGETDVDINNKTFLEVLPFASEIVQNIDNPFVGKNIPFILVNYG